MERVLLPNALKLGINFKISLLCFARSRLPIECCQGGIYFSSVEVPLRTSLLNPFLCKCTVLIFQLYS